MAAFKLSFNIRNKIKKKKVSGEIALALMYKYTSLQASQLPQEHLSFL